MRFFVYLIVSLGLVNLIHMGLLLIGSDWNDMKRHRGRKRARRPFRPTLTVLIPAHNEEKVIERAVASVYRNPYPRKEVIVVDDGSTDRTAELVQRYRFRHQLVNLRLVSQPNQGKAVALNNGLKLARSALVMVLDADSCLSATALAEAAAYFRDPTVVMAASNVKILSGKGWMNLAQRFEYLIGHRVKRSLTAYNCEYIIGGVGSTFWRNVALEAGGYDTDTMTEDIDFTLKIIRGGNVSRRVIYAPSVISYTESVLTFRQLVTQRFRWKYGRLQAFLKNPDMFFSMQPNHDKRLTWLNLPFALYSELAFLLEPLLIGFLVFTSFYYHDPWILLSGYWIMTTYVTLVVLAEDSLDRQTKVRMLILTPVQYPLLLVVSLAEYCASIQVLMRLRPLLTRRNDGASWKHVARAGGSATN